MALVFVAISGVHLDAATVSGTVTRVPQTTVIDAARVTLFTPSLQFFREVRSGRNGAYQFENVPAGTYQIGASALGRGYSESTLTVSGIAVTTQSFALAVETEGGRWTIVGNTTPELLNGSGSGSLLPTGELMYCHNEIDPIVFEPLSATKWFPPGSGTPQGCHVTTLLSDGRLLFVGGSMINGYPQDPIPRTVKVFNRFTNAWARVADINIGRWYPGIVRLPDERLLIMGGEQNGAPGRTNTCEIYDPVANTWTMTGSFNLPTEIPPTFLLYTGEVFKTWRYPEFYNIASGQWRAAPSMLQERLGASIGDHSDHEAVMLEDGRIFAVGTNPVTLSAATRFTEIYDPIANAWSLGPNARHLRKQPEAIMLPDSRVLTFGGQYTGTFPATTPLQSAGQVPNCVKVADLYDPATNSFRALADLNRFIHYHNVTILAPDGRVLATGGAGGGSLFGDDASIEAFEPPYLFRGVRPRIASLSSTDFIAGGSFTMDVVNTSAVTKVVLVGARNSTHWVDGGPQRILPLTFAQSGSTLNVALPADTGRLLPGYYLLFAMVDDIPSVGRIVRVTATTPLPTPTPTPTPTATPMPTRLANISTRLRVETGDNVLIGGFIISGTQPKKVIVRAIGPSLPLSDRLANPTLKLYDGGGALIATNDNWRDAPNRQEIIDSTIPPTNDLESAILRNVDPGAYTAVVSGVNGGTGLGLVEVYDLGGVQDSKLANISTRGLVQTGDNVMIGGVIVTGSSPQKVIVRAIGPSLPVTGGLPDPFLQLYDGNGTLLQSNDSWRSDQEAEIIATTIQPANDLEAAIVRNLPPAAYTAIFRGVNGMTGIALVEVYALQ